MYRKLLLISLLIITMACFSQENGKVINGVLLKTIQNWSLLDNIANNPNYDHIETIIELDTHIALQINYKTKGLNVYDYPFKEIYEPEYSFEKTAWDTLFFFSYPELVFQKKMALEMPMQCIKSVQQLQWTTKELTLIQYCEGIELHKSDGNCADTVVFTEGEADLVALAPNGKKLSYVNYKECGVDEPFANCLIDYNIENGNSYPYNRLLAEPIDDYTDESISRVAAVSDNNRYDSIKYNSNNWLVYYKHGMKPVQMQTRMLKAPSHVYYQNYQLDGELERTYPITIDSKYRNGLLYILSYIDDMELDYKGYTLSLLDVSSNEYIVRHMRTSVSDDGKTIEHNPLTSASSEIQDYLLFELEKCKKEDSIALASFLPKEHKFMPTYIFDSNDSIFVFADAEGLVKMNIETKSYVSFGYADILMWIGYTGSTHSMFDYKAIHLINDDRIVTVQENNMIIEWRVRD